jgi:putative methyltransferase
MLTQLRTNKSVRLTGVAPLNREVHIAFFSANLPKGVRVPRMPYIGAALQAFAETNELVKTHYDFERMWDGRPSTVDVLERLNRPFMFAFSCYVFNFEWTMRIAKAVKEAHPSCVIVAGGPHIPNVPGDFFKKHPYLDVLVHGEGEIPFQDLLLEYLAEAPDLNHVRSISYNKGGESVTTPRGENLPKVLDVPSPWTLGYLDANIEEYRRIGQPVDVLWETNRGCPYSCSFCYWGTLETNKLRTVTMERLKAEVDYFAEQRVDVVWNCDANFGILTRDKEIAQMLADAKRGTGFPRSVFAHHGKKTNDTIYDIIKIHQAVDQLYGGVWMARQSMNEEVLKAIKRPFAKDGSEAARAWKARFAVDKTPVKADLILGLPRETKSSWLVGIGELLRDGFHEDVHIHYLSLLPNTPLADQIEEHGLHIVYKPFRLLVQHSEASEIVVGTRTMPVAEWVECGALSQLILGLHVRGNSTRYLAILLQQERDLPYETFYEAFLAYAIERPDTFVGRLLDVLLTSHRNFADPNTSAALSDSAGEFVPDGIEALFSRHPAVFGAMTQIADERGVGFGPDQYVQLSICANAAEFYRDVHAVLMSLRPDLADDAVVLEALRFQQDIISDLDHDPVAAKQRTYNHNWYDYFFGQRALAAAPTRLSFLDEMFESHRESEPSTTRRLVLARIGTSWFERGRSSVSLNPATLDGRTAATARADRGSG